MRVLHLVPARFGPDGIYGGAERYALELARAMSLQTPTRLVAFGARRGRHHDGELEVVTLRNQLPGRRFATSPASLALLPHFRWAEVIHCHQIYTMGTSAALLYGHTRHKPVFVTDHAGGGWSLQAHWNLQPWFAARLWVSQFSRGNHVPLPADHMIYAGVDTGVFNPDPCAPRGDEVLYVGRLLDVKGVHELLEAVDAATPLALVGPAYDAAYLARLRTLAAGKRVRFLPPVEGAALAAAYQRVACVVMPGIEAFSLAALEAMACATPVIVCAESGLAEVITDGVEGWIVPHGDRAALAARIAWCRTHPAEAAAMGAAARARVLTRFTWPAVAARCLAAYGATAPP